LKIQSITPKLCDGVKYSGTVSYRSLGYDERIELYDQIGGDDDEEPSKEVSDKELKRRGKATMKAIAKMSHRCVTSCEIMDIAAQKVLTWDDVFYSDELQTVVTEVCLAILGKKKASND